MLSKLIIKTSARLLIFMSVFFCFTCNPLPPTDPSYTITFDTQGGSAVDPQYVNHGGLVTQPANPIKNGCTFDGWYKEPECTNTWVFESDSVTDNITLFAKWTVNQYSTIITITLPSGINATSCLFSFVPAAVITSYEINNGIPGDGINGLLIIDGHRWTNEFDYNEGYYVQLTTGNLYIQKNPTITGVFAATDALTWTFTIESTGSCEITSVTATNGATVVVTP